METGGSHELDLGLSGLNVLDENFNGLSYSRKEFVNQVSCFNLDGLIRWLDMNVISY